MRFKSYLAILFAELIAFAPVSMPVARAQTTGTASQLPPALQCFQATAGINGMVGTIGAIVPGAGYVNGTYGGVPLTGGSGVNGTANITVAGGVISSVTILNPGIQYVVGDVLSAAAANLGGSGSGFSFPVASTSINSSLATGTVAYYIPNTLTTKQTWQNSAETVLNQNPVQLDANGCALVYGSGIYRQVVKDNLGNTVWDQLTSSSGNGGGTSPAFSEGVMVGVVVPWAGGALPNHYLYAAGQGVSRTSFPALFAALTLQQNIVCSVGISTVTVPTSTSDLVPLGAAIESSCFAPGTTVSSKSAGLLTLSTTATTTVSTTITIFPWGDGDGATTFTIPDYRGFTVVGRNNMGGNISSTMSSTFFLTNPNAMGAKGGNQSAFIGRTNLPDINYTPSGTINIADPGHLHQFVAVQSGGGTAGITTAGVAAQANSQTGNTVAAVTGLNSSNVTFSGTAAALGGGTTPFSIVQPSTTADYIIKATPDDLPAGPGVTSIGGMTGAIACGTSVVCSANTISVVLSPAVFAPVNANLVLAGPSSGAAATPTFRTLAGADLPTGNASNLGAVFSSTCSSHTWFSSLGNNTGVFGCSQPSFADLTGTLSAGQLGSNVATNANLAQAGAATFKGNPTNATANVQDFTIQGLTARGAPDATNDKIPLYDNASGTIKYVTPGQIASAATSGVSSLNGLTGALTGADLNILNSQTANYTIATGDCGKTIQAGTGSTGLFTVTLPAVTGFDSKCTVTVKNGDTGRGKLLSGFPSDTFSILWPLQTVVVKIVNGAWATTVTPGRWRIPTTKELCYRQDGSATTDGLGNGTVAADCFSTVQAALVAIGSQWDGGGYNACSIGIYAGGTSTVTESASQTGQSVGCYLTINFRGTVTWSTAGACYTGGDNSITILDWSFGFVPTFKCNNTNQLSTGQFKCHQYCVFDIALSGGTAIWLPGGNPGVNTGTNDVFFDVDLQGSATFNATINVGDGTNTFVPRAYVECEAHCSKVTASGSVASSAHVTFGQMFVLHSGSVITSGLSFPGVTASQPTVPTGNSVFITNGTTIPGGTTPTAPGSGCAQNSLFGLVCLTAL